MIFASRPLSFFRSLLRKKHVMGAFTFVLTLSLLFATRPVFANHSPTHESVTPPASAAPASAPAATRAPSQAGAGGAVQDSDFGSIIENASSLSCGGANAACLLSVVGFILTLIFSVISFFLSKLLLVLTSILITFARYNKFNNAPPVQIGWIIVRDISNMFFIVVLLVSAFMTIIGKAESYGFHYSKVIPKLLGAAVLVNFSKTIVLLMIDASQVVTLTFVSAFEGTIAGNLIQGFGLPQMTQLQSPGSGETNVSQVAVNLLNVCIAYLLSIFLLITAVATLLLYVGYFIFRIIALWIILIFSPMAFLASSLPDKVGGIVKTATGDFWGKLTSMLTGGPLIAFFLWLTFATIQQTAQSGLSGDIGFVFPDGAPGFLNQIGTVPQLASFIVAVAMMLIGFGIATKTAEGMQGMSGIVSFVKAQKAIAFKKLSQAPWTMAKGGGRLIGRGIGAGAGALNRRYGLTSQLASGIARGAGGMGAGAGAAGATGVLGRVAGGAGSFFGSAARLIPYAGGALAAGAAGKLAAQRAGNISSERKRVTDAVDNMKSLSPEDRVVAIRNLTSGAMTENQGTLEAQHEAMSTEEHRKAAMKVFEKQETERLQSEELETMRAADPSITALPAERKAEIGRQAKSLASAQLAREEAGRIENLRGYAERANDTVRVAALDKEAKSRMVYSDADYDKTAQGIVNDPGTLSEVDKSQQDSGRFALALMRQAGATNANLSEYNSLAFNSLREKFKDQKSLVATLDIVAKQIEDGGANRALIESSTRRKDGYNTDRLYSGTDDGRAIYSSTEQTAIDKMSVGGSRAYGASFSDDHKQAFSQAMAAGLPMGMIMSAMDNKNADKISDGQAMRYVAERGNNAAAKNQPEAINELSQLMQASVGATPDQRIAVANSFMNDPAGVEKIFGNMNKLSGERQKQALSLLAEVRDLEGVIQKKIDALPPGGALPDIEQAFMKQMEHIRENVLPANKITRDVPAEVKIEVVPGKFKFGTDENGRPTTEPETREVIIKPAGKVEIQAASSAARNILYS